MRIGDLDERIVHLERLRDNLAGCIGCGCLSLKTCALTNPGDVLSQRGPGAANL
jgi:MerR family redox-sensitive transcriptional activator SoxR